MNNKGERLLKNTILFSIGNIGAKLLMLFIVPLYTYFITVEQMGKFDVINTYVALFTPIACLALHEGIYRWLLDKDSPAENVIKSGVKLSFVFLLIFDLISYTVLRVISFEYLLEFIILVDSAAVYTLAQYTTRGLRNNKVYALQGIVYSVILILAQVIFVFWKHMQARGLFLSMAVANIGTTFFMLIAQKIYSKYYRIGKYSRALAPALIKYSLPMVPNNIAWWMVAAASRLIINKTMGDTANGIFAIAMKFPTLVAIATVFFYQAWQEQSISEYDSELRDEYYSKVFNLFAKILITSVIALIPITKIIIVYFMDSSYHSAFKYVGFLYLASVFNAFAAFYGTGYLSTKKTGPMIITTLAGALANIVITILTIKTFGLYAAAFGNLIGYTVIWVMRIIQTKKFFSIKINKVSLTSLLIVTFISIYLISILNNIVQIIVLEILAIIFFCLINKELIFNLLRYLKKKLNRL